MSVNPLGAKFLNSLWEDMRAGYVETLTPLVQQMYADGYPPLGTPPKDEETEILTLLMRQPVLTEIATTHPEEAVRQRAQIDLRRLDELLEKRIGQRAPTPQEPA